MISGGCLCGAVRYSCKGAPLFGLLCYCRDCQRTSGGSHVPIMGVPRAQFVCSGETRAFAVTGGSGQPAARNFCAVCNSLIFGTPDVAPDVITIYAGTLDDPTLFKPDFVQFTRHRPRWDHQRAPIPEFEAARPL